MPVLPTGMSAFPSPSLPLVVSVEESLLSTVLRGGLGLGLGLEGSSRHAHSSFEVHVVSIFLAVLHIFFFVVLSA